MTRTIVKGGSHLLIGYAAVYTAPGFVLPLAASPVDWLLVLGAASIGALRPDVDSDESAIRQATHTARSNGCLGRILTPGISFITGGHPKVKPTMADRGLLSVSPLLSGLHVS